MTTPENTTTAAPASQEIRWHQLLALAFKEPGKLHQAYDAFWDYSLGNQLAALFQCMARGITPGPIATFNRWRDNGRFVKKGAKAISLCMPVSGKRTKENPETGESETVGFRRFIWRRNWFVLEQTEGEAFNLPPPPAWDKAMALSTLGIMEIPFDHLNGNAQGFAVGEQIAVSPIAVLPFKTLFHELAHVVLGHTKEAAMNDDERTPKNIKEIEAESVAMLLCDALGYPGAEFSRGYIQNWGAGLEDIPEKSAAKILSAADKILRAGRGQTVERPARPAPAAPVQPAADLPQLSLAI